MLPRVTAIARTAAVCALTLAACSTDATAPATVRFVDELLAACPKASDIAAINQKLTLTFNSDPTAGQPLACTASAGSADLTFFKMRAYQALIVAKTVQFDAPLPWTSKTLWDWITSAITGIAFDPSPGVYCCSPAKVIHISGASSSCSIAGNTATRLIATGMPCGLEATIAVIVHEARHSEGPPHTCGTSDNTISELGAWGVQYWTLRWFAEHTGTFLSATGAGSAADYYRTTASNEAKSLCSTRFCQEGCPASLMAVLHRSARVCGA